jgi:hypothetical protein
MSDLQDDLDATVESVVRDAERLIAVEREKQAAAGTILGDRLGDEARHLASSITRKVLVEDEIADRLAEHAD